MILAFIDSSPICRGSLFIIHLLFSHISFSALWNKSKRFQTTDAFWRSARVLVSELSFKWLSFMFPMLFCSNSALVCDGRTDRRTDRPTDTPSYRDARTHLINTSPKAFPNMKVVRFRKSSSFSLSLLCKATILGKQEKLTKV